MIPSNLYITISAHDLLAHCTRYHSRDPQDTVMIRIGALAGGIFFTAFNAVWTPFALAKIPIYYMQSRTFSPELLYTCAKIQLVYLCTIVTSSIALFLAVISPEFVCKNIEFHMHARRAAISIFTEMVPDLDVLSNPRSYDYDNVLSNARYNVLKPIAERLQPLMTADNPNLWRTVLYEEIMRHNSTYLDLGSTYLDRTSHCFEIAFENCCRTLEGRDLLDPVIEESPDLDIPVGVSDLPPPGVITRHVPEINKQFSRKLLACMKEARLELIEKEIFPSDEIETMFGESYPAVIELGLLKLLMRAEIESEDVLVFDKGSGNEIRIDNDIALHEQRSKLLEITQLLHSKEMNSESLEALTNLVSRKKMESTEEGFIKEVYPQVRQVFDELVGLRTRTIDTHFISNNGLSSEDRIPWIEAFQA